MAASSRARVMTNELQIPKRWKERETSPERSKIWIEPKMKKNERKVVSVVYYLSRNGQLEHPHFMEVTLGSSSFEGLYLKDVVNRLNVLRGKGMASMYSWSSKRSYKNGFVWYDLLENDFIYPAHGNEYVLKGSELPLPLLHDEPSGNPKSHEISSSSTTSSDSLEPDKSIAHSPIVVNRRRNQSWSSIDLHEYKVYKTDSPGAIAGKTAADASTQTMDKRRRSKAIVKEEEEIQSVELSRDEISPPPSDSSPETLDSLIKSDGRLVLCPATNENEIVPNKTANGNNHTSGRMKASSVLMQLISCGAVSFKDCGAITVKDQGFSLLSQYKSRLPRGGADQSGKEVESLMDNPSFERLRLEDKEYFSGSLIESKKDEFFSLKRSSSYNADRSSQLELAVKEIRGSENKMRTKKVNNKFDP